MPLIPRRPLGLALLLLCGTLLDLHGHAQPMQPSAALAEAQASFDRSDLPTAEATLRHLLATEPTSAEAMYLLGRVLERARQPRESLVWFTRAAAHTTPTGEDLRIVALDYVQLNDYTDAVRWLKRSVVTSPNNAEAWYDLGRAHMMQSDFPAALHPLETSLRLHPRLVKAENNLGVVYEALNQPAKAAEAYEHAIAWQQAEAHPSEQPLLNYGLLLTQQQRSAEALPLLLQATALAPSDPKCQAALAQALEQQGRRPEAIEHLETAVHLDPRNPRLHYQLGQMYRRAGEVEKSRKEMTLSGQLYGTRSAEPQP